MSKEYIEINKETFPTPYRNILNDFMKGWNTCLNSVLNHKVINEEPRQHGEWIPIVNHFHGKPDGRYYCSVCHRVETMKGIYCRLCGAIMDGGSKNGTV